MRAFGVDIAQSSAAIVLEGDPSESFCRDHQCGSACASRTAETRKVEATYSHEKTSRVHERFVFLKMVPKGRRSATARRWRGEGPVRSAA
jgi:hypothetical protein